MPAGAPRCGLPLIQDFTVQPVRENIECRTRAVGKLILAGASAYSRRIEFDRIAAIAREVGAVFFVDMAHIAGLVAAGLHPDPVPVAGLEHGQVRCAPALLKRLTQWFAPLSSEVSIAEPQTDTASLAEHTTWESDPCENA